MAAVRVRHGAPKSIVFDLASGFGLICWEVTGESSATY